MDPRVRRALGLFDRAAERLTRVTAWPCDPERAPGGPWSYHAVPTLVCALDGMIRMEGPQRRIDLQAGEALLLEPACLHRHLPPQGRSIALGLGVLPAWCDLMLLGFDRLHWAARLPLHPTSTLLEQALLAEPGAARLQATRTVLAQVLGEQHEDLALLAPGLWPMVRMLWGCNSDPSVDPAAMVAASGLSRAQAYRCFRAGYGITPAEAITSSRLSLAQWLLRRGIAVGEAARRAGFPSRATFTRLWRRRFGTPPSQLSVQMKRKSGVPPARRQACTRSHNSS